MTTRTLAAVRKAALVVLAVPFLVPLATMAAGISWLFGIREIRTATEVVTYLRTCLEGSGGAWDWDDFISVTIADPTLETIRRRAAALDLPLTVEGEQMLRLLLAEAEKLVAEGQAALSIPSSPSLR